MQSELTEHALRGVAGGKPEASRDTSVRPIPDDDPDSFSDSLGVLGANVSQLVKHFAQEVLNTEELGNKSNTSSTPRAVPAPPTESPACAPKRPPPTKTGFDRGSRRPHTDPPVELSHSAPRTEAVDPPPSSTISSRNTLGRDDLEFRALYSTEGTLPTPATSEA